jgi:hypothetical protein
MPAIPDELTHYDGTVSDDLYVGGHRVPWYMQELLARLDTKPFPQFGRPPSLDLQALWQEIKDTLHFGRPVLVSAYIAPGRAYLMDDLGGKQVLVARHRHELYIWLAGRTWHPDTNCPTADHLGDCGCLTDP